MRRVGFYIRLMSKGAEDWAYHVLGDLEREDKWLDIIKTDITVLGGMDVVLSRKEAKERVRTLAKEEVVKERNTKKSLRLMNLPQNWFEAQCFVSDSESSKAICRIRAGAWGLGNREPNEMGGQ